MNWMTFRLAEVATNMQITVQEQYYKEGIMVREHPSGRTVRTIDIPEALIDRVVTEIIQRLARISLAGNGDEE